MALVEMIYVIQEVLYRPVVLETVHSSELRSLDRTTETPERRAYIQNLRFGHKASRMRLIDHLVK